MTDYTKLRELAAKATPGPWLWEKSYGQSYGKFDCLYGKENDYVFCMHTYEYEAGGHIDISGDNAAFIAAANPTVIIELLDTIDALTKERDKLALEAKAGRELRNNMYWDAEFNNRVISCDDVDAYDAAVTATSTKGST